MPAHSHDRGSYDIWGIIRDLISTVNTGLGSDYGAFFQEHRNDNVLIQGSGTNVGKMDGIGFNANRAWSGVSQTIGSNTPHSHNFTGTSFTFDNNPPFIVVYCYRRIS